MAPIVEINTGTTVMSHSCCTAPPHITVRPRIRDRPDGQDVTTVPYGARVRGSSAHGVRIDGSLRREVAAARGRAPMTGIPGVAWTPVEVTVEQVPARSRSLRHGMTLLFLLIMVA